MKHQDDGLLELKARIAPHGNEDDLTHTLSPRCSTWTPTGLKISESIASLFGWRTCKADMESGFWRTGYASRDVYVRPRTERRKKSTRPWLLLKAAYGLVNCGAKWQIQSNEGLFELGLQQCQQVPQLFYFSKSCKLVLVIAKTSDDTKAAGTKEYAMNLVESLEDRLKLGTVRSGPGKTGFFVITTFQNEDMTSRTDADKKLHSLTDYWISLPRRK